MTARERRFAIRNIGPCRMEQSGPDVRGQFHEYNEKTEGRGQREMPLKSRAWGRTQGAATMHR